MVILISSLFVFAFHLREGLDLLFRLASNSGYSCLCLIHAEMVGMCYHSYSSPDM